MFLEKVTFSLKERGLPMAKGSKRTYVKGAVGGVKGVETKPEGCCR